MGQVKQERSERMDIKTASDWLKAIKDKYIHGGDESCDEQRKEAIDFAIKTMNDQQNLIWELQDLNEHLEDRQKKIHILVDSNGEMHPLEPEPVRCKDCILRGDEHKCVVAFLAKQKDMPLFFFDNRGEWFCADGRKKE